MQSLVTEEAAKKGLDKSVEVTEQIELADKELEYLESVLDAYGRVLNA